MWSYNYTDELYHYGVKGMKWGVRRYEDESGHLTPAGRKRYGEDRYKLNKDGSIEIQKGAELQRIVDGKMSKEGIKGQTYASIGKNDNNQYMNILAKSGTSKVLKLTAKSVLKSPSSEEAADIYINVLKNNSKALSEFKQMKSFAEESKAVTDFDNTLKKALSNKATAKEKSELYRLANYLFVYDDQIQSSKKQFYKEVQNKGYNILRDEYDSLSGVVKSPIIILDGESSVSIKSSKIVTNSMSKKASKYVNKYEKKGEEWAKKHCGIV